MQVPPTRMNLGVYKGKQVAAKKGYDLLKSKADALKVSLVFPRVVLCFTSE
jgi:vacuolar-type H+-ATPase subunit D/Vma8